MNKPTLTKLEYFSIKILAAIVVNSDLSSRSNKYAIDRAKALIEDLNNDNGNWISVDDQSPMDTDRILMYAQNGAIHTGLGKSFKKSLDHKETSRSFIYTHWQLFPEPPKQ